MRLWGRGVQSGSAVRRLETLWAHDFTWRVVLALGVVLGLVARVQLTLTDHGLYWPDEVYQSLEPAHRLAFGYSMVAWEFVVGARNLLLPGLIALVLKALALLGLDAPTFYVPLIRLGFVAASMVTVAGVYRLSRNVGVARPAATVGAVAFSLMSFAIYFSPRAMSEVASALPVTWGLVLLFRPSPLRRYVIGGASLLGLAVLLRIHCGLFAVCALAALALQRRTRDLGLAAVVLAGWAMVYGVLDLWAWGGFLHSALYYLRFNLIEGRAAEWGVAPTAFYTGTLVRGLGAHWVLLATLAVVGLRRASVAVVPAALFLVGHMALPHKELRFIVPMLPLVCVGGAAGIDSLWRWRRLAGTLALSSLLITSVASFATHRALTQRQLGRFDEGSAYDAGGSVTRLLLAASKQQDLCGLLLLEGSRGNTFAYFALHRDVPFYEASAPDESFYNYVIAAAGAVAGTSIATDQGVDLVRVRETACTKDPTFEPYLDERTRSLAHEVGFGR